MGTYFALPIPLADKHPNPNPSSSHSAKITPLIKAITWLTPYRLSFAVAFGLNVVGVALELSGHWSWAKSNLATLVVGNMLCAVGARSEWVLRLVYWLSVKVFRPRFFPLWMRVQIVGFLYHIGGIHSGCGLSVFLWHVVVTWEFFRHISWYHRAQLAMISICLACLFFTCLSAFPVFRGPHHNTFEIIHRFVGWSGLVSTLVFITLNVSWDVQNYRWNNTPRRLMNQLELWILLTIVIIIVLGWVTVNRVRITTLAPSDKASVMRVPGGLTSGLHTRVSLDGIREWHIFGTISPGKDAKYHYIVVAVQGKFTRMINTERPSRIYTKLWKPCGLPYFSRLFSRGLAVCTGSGIGAVGSTCIQNENWFLIWIGPDLEKTYGNELLDLICNSIPPERRLIWDTRGPLGRPNVVTLLQDMHRKWEAEVSLFIGSPTLNQQVLESCKALNIPAFGSIWDA